MKILAASIAASLALAATVPAFAGGPVAVMPTPAPMVAPMVMMAPSVDWTGFYVGAALGYGNAATTSGGSDMLYGVRAGYDMDMGNWVLGGTASYDMTSMQYLGNTVNSVGRVGARLGWDGGKVLPYVTGGAAWAMQTAAVGGDSTEMGWFAGAGAEYQLNSKWTVGGELLTSRFSDNLGSTDQLNIMTVGLNVNYRF